MKRENCRCLLRLASCELLLLPLLLLLAVAAAALAVGVEQCLLLLLVPPLLMRIPITEHLLRDKQCFLDCVTTSRLCGSLAVVTSSDRLLRHDKQTMSGLSTGSILGASYACLALPCSAFCPPLVLILLPFLQPI